MRNLDYDGLVSVLSKLKNKFSLKTHTHTKTQITDFPTSMPADGGHADSATTADSATNATNATNAVNATNAQNATNAESATKATNDSAGQKIDSTYIKSIQVTGTQGTFTRGDNSTGNFTTQDTTYEVVSETADGLAPQLPGDATMFLRGDGTWQVPPHQSGATVNWDDIQGKPEKFTPADGTYPNITVGNATNSKSATIAGTANVANQWSILSYSSEVQTVQPGYALLFNGTNTVTPYPVGQMAVARANNISMSYDGNLHISYS